MKGYLIDIYGKSAVSKDSYEFWKKNNSSFNSKYFIKMFCKNSTCGYAELLITEKNGLYFSNIIMAWSIYKSIFGISSHLGM